MKYLIGLLICIGSSLSVLAQDTAGAAPAPQFTQNRPVQEGFQKQNLFTGGNVILSLSSYGNVLGANPVFGYSFNDWVEAGVSLNFSYLSQRYYDIYGDLTEKDQQTIIGPGAFVRLYPVSFLFLQFQYEHNFIHDKQTLYTPYAGSGYVNYDETSYLGGVGYCGGRGGKGSLFYYVAVFADFGGDIHSPYLYYSGGSTYLVPIFRAGLQVPLFQGKNRY
jgi:hypothetical protein